MAAVTLDHLRRHAVARSLFRPTTLGRAIGMLGFVQADPIRAPARAQDLTLRHRVVGYRAGDLERRYPRLGIEEDALVNYGFVPRATLALLHPRVARRAWDAESEQRAAEVLAFVRGRGPTHPRDVLAAFAHGPRHRLLGRRAECEHAAARRDALPRPLAHGVARERHARLRSDRARRAGSERRGARAGARRPHRAQVFAAAFGEPRLSREPARLRRAAPARRDPWRTRRGAARPARRAHRRHALALARRREPALAPLAPGRGRASSAPFDPIVWDRRRFALLWGWEYRFEAYTPAAKRRFGHYALPLLWGDRVIGWANVAFRGGQIDPRLGYAEAPPRSPAFRQALDLELERLRAFLDAAED